MWSSAYLMSLSVMSALGVTDTSRRSCVTSFCSSWTIYTSLRRSQGLPLRKVGNAKISKLLRAKSKKCSGKKSSQSGIWEPTISLDLRLPLASLISIKIRSFKMCVDRDGQILLSGWRYGIWLADNHFEGWLCHRYRQLVAQQELEQQL
jgi:hypothetical protein